MTTITEDDILASASHRCGFALYPEFDRLTHTACARLERDGMVRKTETEVGDPGARWTLVRFYRVWSAS